METCIINGRCTIRYRTCHLTVFFFLRPQSILKVNGSYDKSRNVSFSSVESEVIGYGGEEYSTDDEYSSDEENQSEHVADSGDDEELKRLTEANTNLNSKIIAPGKDLSGNRVQPKTTTTTTTPSAETVAPPKPAAQNKSPPLVTVQPIGGEPASKSLVFNFLKNKEIAAATATAAAAAKEAQQKKIVEETKSAAAGDDVVQMRTKTETTKRPSLTRSSLVANSNEQFLNIKRCSLQQDDDKPLPLLKANVEIPKVKLHPPPETTTVTATTTATVEEKCPDENEVTPTAKEPDGGGGGGCPASYKTRSNVPRMGTMHIKLKLASTQKPEPPKPPPATGSGNSTPEPSSLTSREMAGEPDGKADSDEPGDHPPTTNPVNKSFLHNFKDGSTPSHDTVSLPRTPPKKKVIILNS